MQRRKGIRIIVWISRISIQTAWPQVPSAKLWRQRSWLSFKIHHDNHGLKDYTIHNLSTWVHKLHNHKLHNQFSLEEFHNMSLQSLQPDIVPKSSGLHHSSITSFYDAIAVTFDSARPGLNRVYAVDKAVVFQYFDISNHFLAILTLWQFESGTQCPLQIKTYSKTPIQNF